LTRRLRGVLFDKDGTLIDFRATWIPAYERLVRELFRADEALVDRLLSAGGFERASGRLDPNSVLAAGTNAEIAALWGGLTGHGDLAALALEVNAGFQAHARRGIVAVTDLPALFGRLRARGLRLGVATNDSAEALAEQLQMLGLAGLVDFLAGYDSGHGTKPAPGMVRAFAESLGARPQEIAVVGDSLHDIEMARAAGAGLVVGVLTGASPREHLAPHVDRVIDSIAALEAVLAEAL
jgi:phosphoglycolate phosphatase